MATFKRGDTAIISTPEKLRHEEWAGKMVVIEKTYEDKDHERYGLKSKEYLCNIINISDYKVFSEDQLDKCDLFRNTIKGEK